MTHTKKELTRNYLQKKAKNIFTFGYGMSRNAYDIFGTLGGTEYFVKNNGDTYKKTKTDFNKFEFIGNFQNI